MDYIFTIMPALLKGLTTTLQLFLLTLALSLPLGLLVSLGAMSRFWPLKAISNVYIWLLRGTPLMLQLFFVYYALPSFGVTLDRFPAAVTTFVLNYSAYFAEIYRAGIQSIDGGQYEAAKVLGFSRGKTMRFIIIPQTIRRIIPPVTNEVITLVKDTALATAIAVPELIKAAKDAANRDVNTTGYVIAAAIYLVLTFALTMVSRALEKKYSASDRESSSRIIKDKRGRSLLLGGMFGFGRGM